jgi:hypothetical protein
MKNVKNVMVIVVMFIMVLLAENEGLIVINSSVIERVAAGFAAVTVAAIMIFNGIKTLVNRNA